MSKPREANRGVARREHFERNGDPKQWRRPERTHVNRKREQDRKACRGKVKRCC